MSPRFRVDPRDVPAEKAARRLHLSQVEFERLLPQILARGFPRSDVTTGMFDLKAIDEWMDRRHPGLLSKEPALAALDARTGIIRERLAARRLQQSNTTG